MTINEADDLYQLADCLEAGEYIDPDDVVYRIRDGARLIEQMADRNTVLECQVSQMKSKKIYGVKR